MDDSPWDQNQSHIERSTLCPVSCFSNITSLYKSTDQRKRKSNSIRDNLWLYVKSAIEIQFYFVKRSFLSFLFQDYPESESRKMHCNIAFLSGETSTARSELGFEFERRRVGELDWTSLRAIRIFSPLPSPNNVLLCWGNWWHTLCRTSVFVCRLVRVPCFLSFDKKRHMWNRVIWRALNLIAPFFLADFIPSLFLNQCIFQGNYIYIYIAYVIYYLSRLSHGQKKRKLRLWSMSLFLTAATKSKTSWKDSLLGRKILVTRCCLLGFIDLIV